MRADSPLLVVVRRYLVPCLLAVVATIQVVRAQMLDQSSWSGGGFGMFATYENEDSRFIRVWALSDDGETRTGLPSDVGRQALEARVVPSPARLRSLSQEIADGLGDEVTAVRTEVWGVRFDDDKTALVTFRIAEGTYRR